MDDVPTHARFQMVRAIVDDAPEPPVPPEGSGSVGVAHLDDCLLLMLQNEAGQCFIAAIEGKQLGQLCHIMVEALHALKPTPDSEEAPLWPTLQ